MSISTQLIRAREHWLIFDDYLTSTTVAFSRSELNEILARPDQFYIFVIGSETQGTGTPTLQIRWSVSPDAVNWTVLTGGTDFNLPLTGFNLPLVVGGEASDGRLFDSLSWNLPQSMPKFFRVQFGLDQVGASTHVRAWVTDRDEGL